MKFRLLAVLCAAALQAPSALADSPLDFSSTPPAVYWGTFVQGTGPSSAVVDGQFQISFPADSSGSVFAAGVTSRCNVQGDFDVVLDYKLLDWPFGNGVRTGIVLGGINSFATGAVERTSFGINDHPQYPSREVYLTHTQVAGVYAVPTTDTKGKLRLVRSGDRITGFYMGTKGWTTINADTVTTGDVSLSLQAWSHDDNFNDVPVKVAFTGFQVKTGTVVCPN